MIYGSTPFFFVKKFTCRSLWNIITSFTKLRARILNVKVYNIKADISVYFPDSDIV